MNNNDITGFLLLCVTGIAFGLIFGWGMGLI
jgi:hypothetical protein